MAYNTSDRFEISVHVFGKNEEQALASFKKRVADLLAEDRDWCFRGGGGAESADGFCLSRYGLRPLTQSERIEDLEREIAKLKLGSGEVSA